MLTLIPSYGRDYKNQTQVKQDWNNKKDFTVCNMFSPYDGKQINKQDAENQNIASVMIRFKKLANTCVIKIK